MASEALVQGGGGSGFHMTQEFMAALAEGIGQALAKQPMDTAGQSDAACLPASPTQVAQTVGAALAPLAGPLLGRVQNRLLSRKLWVTVGTLAGLLVQNPLGLNLSPATQLAAAGLAGLYVAAQALVDSAKKERGDG